MKLCIDLSDEELEEYIEEVNGRCVPWLCEASATIELLRRYNNKKKECESIGKKLANQESLMSKVAYLLKWRHYPAS